jgi:hypothetical protein
LIHCFVLLASLSGAISAGAGKGPVWIGALRIDPRVGALSEARPVASTSVRGVRGKYRRIRLDVPEGPRPPRVALDLCDWRESTLYAGIPRLDREHVSPPSTGPPAAGLTIALPPPFCLRNPPEPARP